MKTTLRITALAAIVGLTLAGTTAVRADAASTSTTSSSSTTTSSDTKFHGSISAIDTTAKTVTVKSKDGDLTLSTTEDLSTFAVGDKVKGSYTTDSAGKMTATDIKKAKAKKSAAAAQ